MADEQKSPTESKRVEIGGRTYQLRPWGVDDGHRWFFRVLKLMTAAAAEHGDEAAAIMAVLQGVDEQTFMEFRDVCCKYTDLVGEDSQGRETVQQLARIKDHLRGDFVTLMRLLRAHVEEQFSGPFVEIARELRGAQAGDEARPKAS